MFPRLYLGFLPKPEVWKFIDNFKVALVEGKKEDEKKLSN